MERTAKRRILSFAVAVAVVTAILLAATLPVGAATSSIMIGASTPAELFDLINNHPADHLDITIDNQDGSVVENGMLTIQNGKTVTLQSTDPSRFAMKNVMVHIQPDSELVLRNIRIEGVTDGSVFGASGGDSVLVINGTAVIENGAVLEGGESETTARGGAAYVAADGTLIMRGGVLRNNRAPQGGAILNLGTVRISGGEIYSNEAAVCGGAIANRDGGSLEISGGRIYGNQAAEDGGAIYTALSSNVEITGGRIYGNEAAANGGGMCSYESRLTVSGGQIVDNTAGQGGAVFNGGELRVSGGALLRSEQIGQGVCSSPAGTLHVDEALTIERAIHLEGAPDDYEGMEVARRNPHIADQAAYFHYIPGNYRVADRYNPEPAAFHMLVLEAVTVPPLNNRPS
ncbi:MAG: hypothetical protein LBV27_03790, partial [Oscillospiraceae bacterium]|nr:hypothetical protein [Oscillospiraceae bacterium]